MNSRKVLDLAREGLKALFSLRLVEGKGPGEKGGQPPASGRQEGGERRQGPSGIQWAIFLVSCLGVVIAILSLDIIEKSYIHDKEPPRVNLIVHFEKIVLDLAKTGKPIEKKVAEVTKEGKSVECIFPDPLSPSNSFKITAVLGEAAGDGWFTFKSSDTDKATHWACLLKAFRFGELKLRMAIVSEKEFKKSDKYIFILKDKCKVAVRGRISGDSSDGECIDELILDEHLINARTANLDGSRSRGFVFGVSTINIDKLEKDTIARQDNALKNYDQFRLEQPGCELELKPVEQLESGNNNVLKLKSKTELNSWAKISGYQSAIF